MVPHFTVLSNSVFTHFTKRTLSRKRTRTHLKIKIGFSFCLRSLLRGHPTHNDWLSEAKYVFICEKKLNYYLWQGNRTVVSVFSNLHLSAGKKAVHSFVMSKTPIRAHAFRSEQQPYIPVTAFSQTYLFLNWISREWDSLGSPMTNHKKANLRSQRHQAGIAFVCFFFLFLFFCFFWQER